MTNSVAVASSADHGGAPPLPHRRPRVREVSSRFMSPSASSISSAGDLHTLAMKSPKHSISTPAPDRSSKPPPSQRRLLLRSQVPEPFSSSSQENIPETVRRTETPFHYVKPESCSTQRRQRAVKLFKENGYGDQIQISKLSSVRTSKPSRPDTPSDRIVPSRFRLPQRQTSSSVSDAVKLLQSTGLSFSSSNINNTSSSNDSATSISQPESEPIQGGSCPNSPISSHHKRIWPLPDTRSSMTDENLLSSRLLVRSSSCSSTISDANCQTSSSSSSSSTPSLCTRSLNLPISGYHDSFKSIDRALYNRALPPQPASSKLGVDSKKGKKLQSSQQEIHSLKMLHNRHLMWRFANAKAQASMRVQTTEMENQFFSLGADISHLRDTVKRKQVELAILRRQEALSTILEAQIPYLDGWSALEEDYTKSLSGAITALTNSLLRLPISGSVQVNIKDAAEAVDSAVKTTDMIVHHMQTFLPKAEEMDSLMSELANIIDVEKALVEECGNLLAKTHSLQVEDCSLRGHLMQLPVLKQ
ncbi:hypothetical protein SSX86_028484 [Deinandra increscens subsp. villosa]|uniref:Uncharacterized protein n=1 Tax=Deinandra increscens subsp. villosa TaxID=3103831 RepID=A0AAP0GJN9_9ASTR